MKAHWQTYVMCLFCRHLDYFSAILEAKKILPTLYYEPRASPGQKICCSLAERAIIFFNHFLVLALKLVLLQPFQ